MSYVKHIQIGFLRPAKSASRSVVQLLEHARTLATFRRKVGHYFYGAVFYSDITTLSSLQCDPGL